MMNRLLMVLLGLTILLSGCAFTTTETARQLDANEVVASGSADFPGFSFIPRLNANVMYGVGGFGDVNAHVGSTIVSSNAGVGFRIYPADRLTLSVQSDVLYVWEDFGFPQPEHQTNLLTIITPRISTAVQDDEFFYAGIQGNILTGIEYDSSPGAQESRFDRQFFGVGIGPFVGVDYHFVESHFGIQIELFVSPIGLDPGGRPGTWGADGVPFPFQLSIGGYFRSAQR